MKKPKTYTRRQVWNILKKWNKESKEPYSVADRFGLLEWFERTVKP